MVPRSQSSQLIINYLFFGFKEIQPHYPPIFKALNLKNIGYTAHQLYDLNYSPVDIVTAYNINFDISGILNYR